VDGQTQRCSYGNGAAVLVFKALTYRWMDVLTDSHMTTKFFQIDGLPNFLRYGAQLTRLWSPGAPLSYFNEHELSAKVASLT